MKCFFLRIYLVPYFNLIGVNVTTDLCIIIGEMHLVLDIRTPQVGRYFQWNNLPCHRVWFLWDSFMEQISEIYFFFQKLLDNDLDSIENLNDFVNIAIQCFKTSPSIKGIENYCFVNIYWYPIWILLATWRIHAQEGCQFALLSRNFDFKSESFEWEFLL